MDLAELRAIDWTRAASFYGGFPDGQWDKEASLACRLMPHLLVLAEKCNAASTIDGTGTIYIESGYADEMCRALDAINGAVEKL